MCYLDPQIMINPLIFKSKLQSKLRELSPHKLVKAFKIGKNHKDGLKLF